MAEAGTHSRLERASPSPALARPSLFLPTWDSPVPARPGVTVGLERMDPGRSRGCSDTSIQALAYLTLQPLGLFLGVGKAAFVSWRAKRPHPVTLLREVGLISRGGPVGSFSTDSPSTPYSEVFKTAVQRLR